MDEKIEVNNETVIDLAKIIHKHYQHIKADWEEYTKSDVALAYSIKWNGYRKGSDTARDIIEWIKLNGTLGYGGYVIHDSTIEQICKKYGVDLGE
jgi:hypothetical protein